MAVYDDEEQKSNSETSLNPGDEELRRLTGINKEQEEAHGREANRGAAEDIAEREGIDKSDDSANDTVGRGYQTNSNKKRKKRFSATKKKASLAVSGAIIAVIISVVTFFSLLPLKIVSLVSNLDNIYQSGQHQAIEKMGKRLFTHYVVNDVLNALDKKGCKTTISPRCVVTPSGTGPVGKLHKAWSNARIERKLADKGLIFGKKGANSYYMQVNGSKLDLDDVIRGRKNLFEMDGTNKATTREIRQAVRNAFKDATLWDKTYTRFKVGSYLVKHLGLPRCVGKWGCDKSGKVHDTIKNKKLAAKAFIIGRTIGPLSDGYSLVALCIMSGDCDSKNLDNAEEGDKDRKTPLNKKITASMAAIASSKGNEVLDKLIKDADSISEKGLSVHLGEKLSAKFSSTAASQGVKVASKAIPVVGWLLMAIQLLDTATDIGPIIQHIGYAVNSAAAARLFMDYSSVAGQIKSGQADATAAGSFSNALSSNLSPEKADENQIADMTSSPMYARLLDPSRTGQKTAFSGVLGQTALAAGNEGTYKCDDGDSVPSGKLVCTEENFTEGNHTASAISDGVSTALKSVGLYTVVDKISGILNAIGNLVGQALSKIMQPFIDGCNSKVGDWLGCKGALATIQDKFADLVSAIGHKLITTPFSDTMSGARIFDMMAAGADVSSNNACKNLVGCQRITPEQAAAIRAEQLAQNQADFQTRPLLARVFDTSSPYSLVSRVALSMPTSATTAGNNVASLVANSPFTAFSGLFGSIFSSNYVFANTAPAASPFGVVQYGVPAGSIPGDPQKYWNDNCTERYDSSTGILDSSDWLNNEDNVGFSKKTGESYFKHVDKCRLILTSIQSVGGALDQSLVPDEEKNSDNGNTTIIGGGASSGGQGGVVSQGGWAWPVSNANYSALSQCYQKPGHTGIDIPAPVGTPVFAARDGLVVKTDPSGSSDGGKYIIIKHDGGRWTNYQHNSKILVHAGQRVSAGQTIARSGNTGNSSGPHIHFSVTTREGLDSRYTVSYSVNPLGFLPKVSGRNLGGCK